MVKRLLLVAVVAAGILLLASGFFRVREGEVALGSGDSPSVWNSGWHWRLPFSGDLQRLPRSPIPLQSELEVRTAEGATIVLDLAGDFGVAEGGEEAWRRNAGEGIFGDGLIAVASRAAEPAVRAIDPADLFQPEAEKRLTGGLLEGLSEAGLVVDALSVRVPAERNPVAAAVVRNQLRDLASPSGRKVLLIGWDGADWLMIRPLLEAGRMPHLASLIRRGASGELRSEKPLLSPLVWTTIATGKPVVEHGIADFLVQDPDTGGLVPISSSSRKVHALWTLLPAFELSVDVVAWWATWPAEAVQGTMVTDRVAYQLFEYEETEGNDGKVHPDTAWNGVQNHLVAAEQVPFETVQRFVDVDRQELARLWDSLPAAQRQEEKLNHLRKIIATTQSYHAITKDLLSEQADLTMAYYEGTDTVGHLFARFLPPRLEGVSADEVRRFGRALPQFYEYADELLGELLETISDDTVVMLVSDHGFFTGEARPESDPANFAEGAPQWHRQYGIVVAAGPGVQPGEVRGASIFDVAPTVLALLGLPIPEDMPGKVLSQVAAAPPSGGEALASYEILPRSQPGQIRVASALDEERLRELVALGYISPTVLEERQAAASQGGGGSATPRASEPSRAASETASGGGTEDLQAMATEAYNLGRIHQRQGDFDRASEQFRLAVDRMPEFGLGYAALAQVESNRGDHSGAFDLLVEGFSKSGSMPMSAITGLVDEAKRCGRLQDAGRELSVIQSVYGGQAAYHAAIGLLQEETGRPNEALEAYDRALAIDPLDHLATEQKIGLLRQAGRESDARAFLDRSFDLAAGQVTQMNQLAVIALRQGWAPQAERLLRGVLASDPGNPGVLANLAASLMQQRKTGQALEAMSSAVERDPDNAGNHFNLGAMLAEQGRFAEALAAFEMASAKGLRNARVYIAASKMHFRLGDPGLAEQALVEALSVEPSNAEARQLLSILRQGAG
ncbi:MAG: alkaline phosphatase family protein [Acidobacteriota bacterium]